MHAKETCYSAHNAMARAMAMAMATMLYIVGTGTSASRAAEGSVSRRVDGGYGPEHNDDIFVYSV